MITVTPRLCVGTFWESKTLQDTLYTEDAQEAVHAMAEDMTVFISPIEWEDMARLILSQWLTPEQVDTQIHLAKTGKKRKQ